METETQTDIRHLIRKIERAVTAPYTPNLYSIERDVENASDAILSQWVDLKPCQVPLFAAVLLEQRPTSNELLARFGYIEKVRDALLDREPALLDQSLQSVLENGQEKDINVCVALLSNLLPENTAAPARVPAFLTKLLGDVAQNPCVAKIKPLYDVMQGLLSNPDLIQLLPNNLMEAFQREGTKILRNLNDPLGTLLSLATFTRIRKLWKPRNATQKQPQWLLNICQIFGPKSSSKTLDLVIISAVMACSTSSNGYKPSERVLLVKLAIEICQEIDGELRKSWLTANSTKLAKLCEKLKRPDIHPQLHVTGLVLLVTFSQWLILPGEVYQSVRDRLYDDDTYNVINTLPQSVIDTLFERLLAHYDTEYLELCLSTIHGLELDKQKDYTGRTNLKIRQLLISTLRRSEGASDLRRSFLRRLSESEVAMGVLRNFAVHFSTRKGNSQCQDCEICNASFFSEKDKLFLEWLICIHSAMDAESLKNQQISFFYHGLFDLFLRSLQENAVIARTCFFSELKEPERNGFFPRGITNKPVTENAEGSSHKWRSKVANILVENARTSHETVIQQIEAMLEDFENRCSNVEEPLAVAVRQREELNQQLEAAMHLNQQLEEQVRQSTDMVNGLRKQLDEFAARARDHSFQITHLTDQVDALQNELETTRKEARDDMETINSKARDRELDLMATVAERDDLLEEQMVEIEGFSKERARLQEALDASTERHQEVSRDCENLRHDMMQVQKDAAQERDILRHEISKLQQVMEIRESTNVEKDNRIITLGETNRDLQRENQLLKDKLERAQSDLEKSVSALEETRQKYKSGIASIEARCQDQVSIAEKQAQQMAEQHQLEVSMLRHDAANSSAKAEKELRARSKRIQYLEKKVEALRNERAAKAREFSEAQEHISRLMSVMGFSKEKDEPRRNPRTASRSKTTEHVRRSTDTSLLQAKSPSQPEIASRETQSSDAAIPPISTELFFHPDATTTSRRSHRFSQAMSFASEENTTYLSSAQKTAIEGPSTARRQPLGDLDRNSPKKSPPSTNPRGSGDGKPDQATQNESQTNIEITVMGDLDLDFADEDILTSTLAR